jgi:group I intron endonuclease
MKKQEITSLKVYANLSLEVKIIFKENKGKVGIYRWNNLITGSSYIGSAIDLTRRLRDYFSLNFLEKEILVNNSIIYRALLKYGYSNFSLEILEYCEIDILIKREQYYIDLFKPDYNICPIAGSSLGRVINPETLVKLRNASLRRLFNKSNYTSLREFTIKSLENKLLISELKIKRLNARFIILLDSINNVKESKVSLHTRMKILVSSKTKQTVLVTDTQTSITTTYLSSRRAAFALNASNFIIRNRLNGVTTKLYKKRYLIKGLINK